MRIAEKIKELTETAITQLGYRLYDIDFLKEPEGYVLTVYIDADSPVTLDDCEKVSRAIEPIIDEADPITQPYYLSVSSIGLDRPLKIEEDFKRNIGNNLDIKLYAPLESSQLLDDEKLIGKSDKIKQFEGILEDYDSESIIVKAQIGKQKKTARLKIAKKACASLKPHIDF